MVSGYVYLIGSSTFGWYKIGKAVSPDVRVRELGILLPFKIEVFAIWRAENHHLLESVLHEKYAAFAINGEWFHFTSEELKRAANDGTLLSVRVYPSDDSAQTLSSFSNIKEDKFCLDKTRYSKRGKLRLPPEEQERRKQAYIALRRAMLDWLSANGLEDTPHNRKKARAILRASKS